MSELEFDETFDFVVAGSGGGSMCAGLVMRSLGKSCVVLEKMPRIGGTTSRSGATGGRTIGSLNRVPTGRIGPSPASPGLMSRVCSGRPGIGAR